MAVEVYTGVKLAIPRRTLFASIFAFLLVSLLAAAMTWTRSGDKLAPRITPEGWSVSFRPPQRFVGEFGLTKLGPAYQFYGSTKEGVPATLVVYHLEGTWTGDAATACDRVLRAHIGPGSPPAGIARLTRLDRKLGTLDAVEMWDSLLNVVVRAVVLEPGNAYALSASVHGAPLDAESYGLFNHICASVEYRRP